MQGALRQSERPAILLTLKEYNFQEAPFAPVWMFGRVIVQTLKPFGLIVTFEVFEVPLDELEELEELLAGVPVLGAFVAFIDFIDLFGNTMPGWRGNSAL